MRKARLGPSRRKKTGPHESSTSRRTITRGSGKENLVEPDLRYVDLNELHLTLEEAEKQFRDPAAKTQRFKVEKSRRYGRRTARPDPGEQESPPNTIKYRNSPLTRSSHVTETQKLQKTRMKITTSPPSKRGGHRLPEQTSRPALNHRRERKGHPSDNLPQEQRRGPVT